MFQGGIANNIIAQLVSLVFDIRLATDTNEEQFDAQVWFNFTVT